MRRRIFVANLLALGFGGTAYARGTKKSAPMPFVVQMVMGDSKQQRFAFTQIMRVLNDLGSDKVRFEVLAYEGGIHSLLESNEDTATQVAALQRQGVKFKACRISMRANDLTEADFPLEVEYVPAGAPELIRLQTKGYRYWRP